MGESIPGNKDGNTGDSSTNTADAGEADDTSTSDQGEDAGSPDGTSDTGTTTDTGSEPPACESTACSVPPWVSPLQVHPSNAAGPGGVGVRDWWSDGVEDWILLASPVYGTEATPGVTALQRWRGPFEMSWEYELPGDAGAVAVDVESGRVLVAVGPPLTIHIVSMEAVRLEVMDVPDWEPVGAGMGVLGDAVLIGGRSTGTMGAISHIEAGRETWRVVDPGGLGVLQHHGDLRVVGDVIVYCANDGYHFHVLGFDGEGNQLWHWEHPLGGPITQCLMQAGRDSVAVATQAPPTVHLLDPDGAVLWSEPVDDRAGTRTATGIAALAPGENSVWAAVTLPGSPPPTDPPVDLRAVAPGATDCCSTPISSDFERPHPRALIRFGNEAALVFADECDGECRPPPWWPI